MDKELGQGYVGPCGADIVCAVYQFIPNRYN